ncbi:MAG TPA: ATP synthase F0 subunit C [Oligoflexia bacterium]|nr:ATP synthase F0 subunit C [Oligoflexia bacterium]HMR25600.1 ATP synthase F0 subunit C [Oligoflexia bacterium]
MSIKHIFGLVLVLGFGVAFADDSAAATEAVNTVAGSAANMWYAIAAAFCMGIAAFGGAMGQSKALSSALDGIARNPGAADKVFMPMIVGLALIESLVLFGLAIAFLILRNIG